MYSFHRAPISRFPPFSPPYKYFMPRALSPHPWKIVEHRTILLYTAHSAATLENSCGENHGKPIIFHQSVSESHRRCFEGRKKTDIQNILYKLLNLKEEIVFSGSICTLECFTVNIDLFKIRRNVYSVRQKRIIDYK